MTLRTKVQAGERRNSYKRTLLLSASRCHKALLEAGLFAHGCQTFTSPRLLELIDMCWRCLETELRKCEAWAHLHRLVRSLVRIFIRVRHRAVWGCRILRNEGLGNLIEKQLTRFRRRACTAAQIARRNSRLDDRIDRI